LTHTLPSHLYLDGVTVPRIDGYINRTGDGIGDNLANWNGTEYEGFSSNPLAEPASSMSNTLVVAPVQQLVSERKGCDCFINQLEM
jgi:hypothetical protein